MDKILVTGSRGFIGKQVVERLKESEIMIDSIGSKRIDLMTAFDNKPGQHLYEKLGYKNDQGHFLSYSLDV